MRRLLTRIRKQGKREFDRQFIGLVGIVILGLVLAQILLARPALAHGPVTPTPTPNTLPFVKTTASPVIQTVSPAPPTCVLRNSTDPTERLLVLTGQNFPTTDHNLQFQKVSGGATSIHFAGEVNWESDTRITLDMDLVKALLFPSDPRVRLRVRLTIYVNGNYQAVSDWSPEFILADDALTCNLVGIHPPNSRVINVYVMNFDPLFNSQPLHEYMQWFDPNVLMPQHINDVAQSSGSVITYQIVKQSDIRTYPTKPGGFVFTNQRYLNCLSTNGNSSPHCPEIIDYQTVLNTPYDASYGTACAALATKGVDEIWLWGGPWFGYYEFEVVSPKSWCSSADKQFTVMGFSYERGLAEMLHDLGHRAESALQSSLGIELWDQFDGQRQRYGQDSACPALPDAGHPEIADPNNTHAGNVHFPPNAYCHYQYDRNFPVQSDATDWSSWPNLTGQKTTVNYTTWCPADNDCHRGFLKWWLSLFPRRPGAYNDIYTNWWHYIYPLPKPAITSLNPTSATAGSGPFTLTTDGLDFVNGSVVTWDNVILPTTFISRTQLTALVSGDNIATAGVVSVRIYNPAPDGGLSDAQTFTINSAEEQKVYLPIILRNQ